jgi:hypothetical protein
MITIAGGIILAVIGLFALVLVVSMIARLFTRKKPSYSGKFPLVGYDPNRPNKPPGSIL